VDATGAVIRASVTSRQQIDNLDIIPAVFDPADMGTGRLLSKNVTENEREMKLLNLYVIVSPV
jgi:hypothetical protein